jgi:hypothetical protein
MVYKVTDRPSSRQPWTVECLEALSEALGRGESIPDIAGRMGRSQEALRKRAQKSGMLPTRGNKG